MAAHDDRLRCLGRDVVIRCEFKSEAVNVAQREGFSDALLVGSALVAATHSDRIQAGARCLDAPLECAERGGLADTTVDRTVVLLRTSEERLPSA